ncbi:uncharacterized protein PHALS_07461 [Plasmopara halstedii]|uniref:Uncharacterized protein n=1 Tax=Plasmopara halstedii TaxID=4781 RepID=A0A0P1B797_PLAHL|nr:uncharacterized protein PHALS_07461 [Plasmopara halstedii]CEG49709.1 hypothetical protein PHALS_07461 [Plasmopara halstedii]|eukprot:XP_024586078.1 hypothetical protein PHALS_07461 [Plasmopara halstedii]
MITYSTIPFYINTYFSDYMPYLSRPVWISRKFLLDETDAICMPPKCLSGNSDSLANCLANGIDYGAPSSTTNRAIFHPTSSIRFEPILLKPKRAPTVFKFNSD